MYIEASSGEDNIDTDGSAWWRGWFEYEERSGEGLNMEFTRPMVIFHGKHILYMLYNIKE